MPKRLFLQYIRIAIQLRFYRGYGIDVREASALCAKTAGSDHQENKREKPYHGPSQLCTHRHGIFHYVNHIYTCRSLMSYELQRKSNLRRF